MAQSKSGEASGESPIFYAKVALPLVNTYQRTDRFDCNLYVGLGSRNYL